MEWDGYHGVRLGLEFVALRYARTSRHTKQIVSFGWFPPPRARHPTPPTFDFAVKRLDLASGLIHRPALVALGREHEVTIRPVLILPVPGEFLSHGSRLRVDGARVLQAVLRHETASTAPPWAASHDIASSHACICRVLCDHIRL